MHYCHEKDDVVTEKDYLVVYGKIELEFNINDFIEETFMLAICFGFGLSGFNYMSQLIVKCIKVCETKNFFNLRLLGYNKKMIITKKWW